MYEGKIFSDCGPLGGGADVNFTNGLSVITSSGFCRIVSWGVSCRYISGTNGYVRVGLVRGISSVVSSENSTFGAYHDTDDTTNVTIEHVPASMSYNADQVIDQAFVKADGGIYYKEYPLHRMPRKGVTDSMGLVVLGLDGVVRIRANLNVVRALGG